MQVHPAPAARELGARSDSLAHRGGARRWLCRDRLTLGADGRVFWELKRPHDDGTTHLAFEPLTFLERLAALVPPPRGHTVLYHGILSSNAAWRAEVLPEAHAVVAPASEDSTAPSRPPEAHAADSSPAEPVLDAPQLRARRLRWAALLQRVFGIDVLHCERCGGRREIVAFIVRPAEVKRICAHLGYPTEPPPIAWKLGLGRAAMRFAHRGEASRRCAPARAPPQAELWDQRITH